MINEYTGTYAWLNHNYPITVSWRGYVWSSALHALLGSMFIDEKVRKAISELTLESALVMSENLKQDCDMAHWDRATSLSEIIRCKFAQNIILKDLLVDTGTEEITGPDGALLMEYRETLLPGEIETLLLSAPDMDIHDKPGVLESLAHKDIKIETLPDIGAISISGPLKILNQVVKKLPKNITTEKKEQVSAL